MVRVFMRRHYEPILLFLLGSVLFDYIRRWIKVINFMSESIPIANVALERRRLRLENLPARHIAKMMKMLGDEMRIQVEIEPVWQHFGCVTRTDGTKTYFRGAHFDLNGMGSMEVAVDKGFASHFLQQAGFNVIPGKTFYAPQFAESLLSGDSVDAAYQHAKNNVGFPVVLKPNTASQGRLVCVANDRRTFMQAARAITKIDKVFLVQPLVEGHDYRIVVLDGEVLSAYERLPLTVTGDGMSTIDQLLCAKQEDFELRGRDTKIQTNDFRISNRLRRYKMTRATVLPMGSAFALLDNKNLSSGGEAVDATADIHPSYATLAAKIVKTMGLRYCGLDLMVQDDIRKPLHAEKNSYQVIEINSAPGVDHYGESGDKQNRIVAEIYRKILIALAGRTSGDVLPVQQTIPVELKHGRLYAPEDF